MEKNDPALDSFKILIVDDDTAMLALLSDKLKGIGYEVVTTTNGVEALKILSEDRIDLMISDITMPCISGFTLLKMLKNFYFNNIPVILMSARCRENALLDSQGIVAKDFFPKPIDFEKLFNRIAELVPAMPVLSM